MSGDIESTPEWAEIIQAACKLAALGLRVSMTARIVELDEGKMLATVQPVVADDDGDSLAPIPSVPIILPGGEEGGLVIELVAGDEVELVFADRSEDTFLETGEVGAAPDSKRSHALTDARAFPGLLVNGEEVARPAGAKASLQRRDGSVAVYVTATDVVALPNGAGFVRLGSAGASAALAFLGPVNGYLAAMNAAILAAVPGYAAPPGLPLAGTTKVTAV